MTYTEPSSSLPEDFSQSRQSGASSRTVKSSSISLPSVASGAPIWPFSYVCMKWWWASLIRSAVDGERQVAETHNRRAAEPLKASPFLLFNRSLSNVTSSWYIGDKTSMTQTSAWKWTPKSAGDGFFFASDRPKD